MPRTEALKLAQQRYRQRNRNTLNVKQNEYLKKWRANPENREKIRLYNQKYRQKKLKERFLEKQTLFPDLN